MEAYVGLMCVSTQSRCRKLQWATNSVIAGFKISHHIMQSEAGNFATIHKSLTLPTGEQKG